MKKIIEIWKKFGEFIGNIMSNIILTIIYFIVITPFGIFYRFLNKKFIKLDSSRTTYWQDRQEKEFTLENYKRQF